MWLTGIGRLAYIYVFTLFITPLKIQRIQITDMFENKTQMALANSQTHIMGAMLWFPQYAWGVVWDENSKMGKEP